MSLRIISTTTTAASNRLSSLVVRSPAAPFLSSSSSFTTCVPSIISPSLLSSATSFSFTTRLPLLPPSPSSIKPSLPSSATFSSSSSPNPPSSSLPTCSSVQSQLNSALQRICLLSRQRNSFEQLFVPLVKLQEVLCEGFTATFTCPVTQEMCHYEGILHTGQFCAIVSNISALHTSCVDPEHREVVTVEVNMSFLNKCRVGDVVTISSTVINLTRRTASAEIKVHKQGSDGKPSLLAAARHSMMLTGPAGFASAAVQREEALPGGCDFM
eukprot:GHVS01061033.1.p1 GENE.GHVS01061033.1~~GHVS01061033.1.p1  ORF type:complete len:270 (+),score=89.85 GHVS01061033.1:231-1040(+)